MINAIIYNTTYIIYLQSILFGPDSTILEESNMHFGPYMYTIRNHTEPYPIQKCHFCIYWKNKANLLLTKWGDMPWAVDQGGHHRVKLQ